MASPQVQTGAISTYREYDMFPAHLGLPHGLAVIRITKNLGRMLNIFENQLGNEQSRGGLTPAVFPY